LFVSTLPDLILLGPSAYRPTIYKPFAIYTPILSRVQGVSLLQAPLVHFFFWGQAAVKRMNVAVKAARADNRTYLGVTPLSDLVTCKAVVIYEEFSNLLIDTDGWLPALQEVGAAEADRAEIFLLVILYVLVVGFIY
jgi:hypothetical protein